MLRRNLIVITFAVAGLALVLVVVNKINRPDEQAFFFENAPRLDLIPTASDRGFEGGTDRFDDKSGNDSRTFAIAFPDGEVIQLQRRPRQPGTRQFPDRLIDEYEALRAVAAEGDAEAAYVLGASLRACGHSAPTEAVLKKAIDQMYQTHRYESFRGQGYVYVDASEPIEAYERSMRDSYARCVGVSDQQIEEADDWLAIAATRGDHEAMRLVMSRDAGSGLGFRAARELWEAGDVIALGWIANYYSDPYDNSIVDPDPVKAYAYLFLSTSFTLQGMSDDGPTLSRAVQVYREELAAVGAALSPLELEQSLTLAKTLLRNNRNCCLSGDAGSE